MTTATLPPLNWVADDRVRGLSHRASFQLLVMCQQWLNDHGSLDRATFLRLADEAEAVTS